MREHFTRFLANALSGTPLHEAAARMGLSPSHLRQILDGGGCEPATLAKVVAGVSSERWVRAGCMAAHLRDVAALAGAEAELIAVVVRKAE